MMYKACGLILLGLLLLSPRADGVTLVGRKRISVNACWRFLHFTSTPDSHSYNSILKPWILPSGNDVISNAAVKH
jgi:hypothetical protein